MAMPTTNNKMTSLALISSENPFSVVTQPKGLSIFLITDKAESESESCQHMDRIAKKDMQYIV